MARKNTASAAHVAPSAPESAVETIRRVARAKAAPGPAKAPHVRPVEPPAPEAPKAAPVNVNATIDPAGRDARKQIGALFPTVARDVVVAAPPGADRWATIYLRANAEIAKLESEKETAGNHLRLAIGDALGIESTSFKATWGEQKGDVDWISLAKDMGISQETIDKYRRPNGRTLRVTSKG